MTNSCRAEHFDLIQAGAAARTVGAVAQLGDDALQAQPAGMAQHDLALVVEMFAVADRVARLGDERGQQRLALDQRQGASGRGRRGAEGRRRSSESGRCGLRARSACSAEKSEAPASHLRPPFRRRGPAVVAGRAASASTSGLPNRSVQSSPLRVSSVTRAVLDLRLEAVAVELDLVQPAVAAGGRLGQGRQRRRDEGGQGRLLAPLIFAVGGLARRALAQACFAPLAAAFARLEPAGFAGDLLDRTAGLHRLRSFLEDVGVAVGVAGAVVLALDQQPVLALFAAACRASAPDASGPVSFSPCSSNSRWPLA